MKLTVSLLAVLTAFAVVVQAGRNFEKLPALDRHAALAARNKALYGNGTPKLRRTCKPKPVSRVSNLNVDRKEAYYEFYAPVQLLIGDCIGQLGKSCAVSSCIVCRFTLSFSFDYNVNYYNINYSIDHGSAYIIVTSFSFDYNIDYYNINYTTNHGSAYSIVASFSFDYSFNHGSARIIVISSYSSCNFNSSSAPDIEQWNQQQLWRWTDPGIEEITALSGPNGHIDFLTCGINESGWNPPLFKIESVVTADLSAVAYRDDSTFANCKDFVPTFEKYGSRYGIPAILLASFAMQESSCKPSTVGGAGEQGLMQLTSDKCVGAPKGDCKDVDFNIGAGAKFFSQLLKENDGDLLSCIGHYNGWFKGMTYADATAAAHGGNCREQNNLDYLHQFLNGWCQDVDAYQHNPPLGKYFNLNVCN
ncbi:hypothetical protein EDB19DRAFT_2039911 [Suillus lakei]|nr:hypothetical protein EDB19DRAFT_2039911 [Suillus lakei]